MCVTTWSVVTPSLNRRWCKCSACIVRSQSCSRPPPTLNKPRKPAAIISYDEKPRVQAIATTDLPPEPANMRASRAACWPASICSLARSMPWSKIATAARVHRIPQASRRRLSGPHCDQVNPRQSFRAYLQKKQRPGSPSYSQAASSQLRTALGSI